MINYIDYLKTYAEYYDAYNEEDFSDMMNSFSAFDGLKDVDLIGYNFNDDLGEYIFYQLFSEYMMNFGIDDFDYTSKTITLDSFGHTLQDLEDLKNELAKGGWTIVNYDVLYRNIGEGDEYDRREMIERKLAKLSVDELENMYNTWKQT